MASEADRVRQEAEDRAADRAAAEKATADKVAASRLEQVRTPKAKSKRFFGSLFGGSDSSTPGSPREFSSCSSPRSSPLEADFGENVRAGWLLMLGRNRKFHKRYCILREGALYYYHSKPKVESEPTRKCIQLEGYVPMVEGSVKGQCVSFQIVHPAKPIHMFIAPSEAIVSEWVKALHMEMFREMLVVHEAPMSQKATQQLQPLADIPDLSSWEHDPDYENTLRQRRIARRTAQQVLEDEEMERRNAQLQVLLATKEILQKDLSSAKGEDKRQFERQLDAVRDALQNIIDGKEDDGSTGKALSRPSSASFAESEGPISPSSSLVASEGPLSPSSSFTGPFDSRNTEGGGTPLSPFQLRKLAERERAAKEREEKERGSVPESRMSSVDKGGKWGKDKPSEQEKAEREKEEKLEKSRQALAERERVRIEAIREKAEKDRVAIREKFERDNADRVKAENERFDKSSKADKGRPEFDKEKTEQARLEKEKAEQARLEKEKADKARLEREKTDKERADKERADKERADKERADKERADKERADKERADKERADKARLEKAKIDKERADKERADRERADREKAKDRDKVEREKAERERADKEKADKERADKEKVRIDKEKADKERADKERADKERAERAKAEKDKADRLAEKAKVDSDAVEREKLNKEKLAKEKAEKDARERAARQAEAERAKDLVTNNQPKSKSVGKGMASSIPADSKVGKLPIHEYPPVAPGVKMTGMPAMLNWCQRSTRGFPGVQILNFTKSWQNGLAFAALCANWRPDVMDYWSLDPADALGNLQKAFRAAEKIGVSLLLDAEDVVDVQDAKSLYTQMTMFHRSLNHLDPAPRPWESGSGSAAAEVEVRVIPREVKNLISLVQSFDRRLQELNWRAVEQGEGESLFEDLKSALPKIQHWKVDFADELSATIQLYNRLNKDIPTKVNSCLAEIQSKRAGGGSLSTCASCGKALSGRTVEALNMFFHADCFKCHNCGKALVKTCINVKDKPHCDACGRNTLAQR